MSSDTFKALFNDPDHAARYADGPTRFMPGYDSVQRMASVLIRERTGENAHVLVHGAGGGAEIGTFAQLNPRWTFTGVEPARAMLDQAIAFLGPLKDRVAMHHGYIDDAPDGPFDAATSLLTLHFIEEEARSETVSQIIRRLKPGAPFVTVHCSFPQIGPLRDEWLLRHRAFTITGGTPAEVAEKGRADLDERIPVLNPSTDEAILRNAGLTEVTEFFSAFTWRGWVGYAP
ncbi:MAG: class I SAM-dependent methyltransferase [Pseudomonadota bacterium]